MAEYIEKDVAINTIMGQPPDAHYPDWYASQIKDIPAADVAPVVRGYWIRHDDADIVEGYYVPEYECSKCKSWVKDDTDFCPHCGARMDGERKE